MYVFTMVAVKKFEKLNTVSVDNAEVIGQHGECQCLEVREMKKKKGSSTKLNMGGTKKCTTEAK